MDIYLAGAIGGLVGGVVFGFMMAQMGMLKMIAMMAKSESVAVGWIVHLIISTIFGLIYVLALPSTGMAFGIYSGLIYGVFWWVLGANVIMPIMMKGKPMWSMPSLMGHLIYGLLLGLTITWLI